MAGTASTMLQISNFSDLVSLTRQMVEVDGPKLVQDLEEVKSLFITSTVPFNSGNSRQYTSYDPEMYASYKSESADAQKKRFVQGDTKTLTARRFAAEVTYSWEAKNWSQNQSDTVTKLTSLAKFIPQRQALDMTHVFTFATATSYTDMDGETVATTTADALALIYSAHTVNGTSTTYSNVITGNPVFSKGSYQTARNIARRSTVDHFGKIRTMNFDTVVTGPDESTVDEVNILKASTADPTAAQSGVVNSYKGSFRHVVLYRLPTTAAGAWDTDKEKYWFLVATQGSANERWNARFDVYQPTTMKAADEDVHNDDVTLGTRGGWAVGAVDWRGIVGSTGLGA